MITVGLLWHSTTSDNLGVGALTQSQIAICKSAAKIINTNIRFIIFGTMGGQDYVPAGAEVIQGSRISLRQIVMGRSPFMTELDQCDVILDIGEGDSFTDIYGFKRLLFLFVTKYCVLQKKIPLVISPQTIGPFNHWINRKVASTLMKHCTKVFARDYQSADYLLRIGVKKNTDAVVDVAFRLPFTHQLKIINNKCDIGINVSGLLFTGGYEGTNQFGLKLDYPELIRKLLKKWTDDDNNVIWLIAHVIPDELPRDDDRLAIAKLKREFPKIQVAPVFKSPEEAKSFISGMNFVTGARMHACIAALSTGVAVMPVAYSRKFNGLFSSLNYPHFVDAKCDSTEQAFDAICAALDKRIELSSLAKDSQRQALVELKRYEMYLINLFKDLSRSKKNK
jgi:colanic acid/amylovoran biosynthesis protein